MEPENLYIKRGPSKLAPGAKNAKNGPVHLVSVHAKRVGYLSVSSKFVPGTGHRNLTTNESSALL